MSRCYSLAGFIQAAALCDLRRVDKQADDSMYVEAPRCLPASIVLRSDSETATSRSAFNRRPHPILSSPKCEPLRVGRRSLSKEGS